MDNKYTPTECKNSVLVYGIYVCRLEHAPCALHKGERCYMQKQDESIARLAKAFEEARESTKEN